jgi:beta-glucosidase
VGERVPPDRRRHPQGLPRHAGDAAVPVRPRPELHTFGYGELRLGEEQVDAAGEIRASLTVANTGGRAGTEIVQLYAADTATGVTLPAQQLVGFARVDLAPGASATVAFTVPLDVLAYTGVDGDVVVEPGPVELSAGSSSDDIRATATVTVTGRTRVVDGRDRAFLSRAEVRG